MTEDSGWPPPLATPEPEPAPAEVTVPDPEPEPEKPAQDAEPAPDPVPPPFVPDNQPSWLRLALTELHDRLRAAGW